jgi:hypothetical protein
MPLPNDALRSSAHPTLAEAEPAEHIVERNDYYYIHLKPITTDDNQLRQLHNFPREVPVFIPMPPH